MLYIGAYTPSGCWKYSFYRLVISQSHCTELIEICSGSLLLCCLSIISCDYCAVVVFVFFLFRNVVPH